MSLKFCWCQLLEPGGSARASSKRLAACLLLEPGGSVRASSKRLATCLLLEPGGSVRASSKRLAACLLYEPGGSVHAVAKSPAMFAHSHSIPTALDASRCKTEWDWKKRPVGLRRLSHNRDYSNYTSSFFCLSFVALKCSSRHPDACDISNVSWALVHVQICTLYSCFWHHFTYLQTHSPQGVHVRNRLFVRVGGRGWPGGFRQGTCCWRRTLFLTWGKMEGLSIFSLSFDGGGSVFGCMCVYTHSVFGCMCVYTHGTMGAWVPVWAQRSERDTWTARRIQMDQISAYV